MDELVVKRNEVINSAYRLSIVEQRIVLSAIARIPKKTTVSDDVLYFVTADDIAKMGSNEKNVYRDIKAAVNRLYERSIMISENGKIIKMRWVQEIQYDDGEGLVGIRFSKSLLPYISNVRDQFTQYLLSEVAQMKGIYSIRIYEMCKQYEGIGERIVSIEELREFLQLGDKYKLTGHFMSKVVNSSVEEINRLTGIKVVAKVIKRGRKFSHIQFTIKPNKKTKKTDATADTETTDWIAGLAEWQITFVARNEAFQAHLGSLGVMPQRVLFKTTEAMEVGIRFLKKGEFTPADKRAIDKALSLHKPSEKK